MKLPAKIEYALTAVLELSVRNNAMPVQLTEIAAAQNIPEKFLIQIFQRLKAADIVSSTRGVAGGYFLARNPSSITMADVIKAVDSTLFEKAGGVEGAEASKNSAGRTLIFRTWNSLSEEVISRLEHITFEQLSNDLKNEQLTYFI